MMTPEQKYFLDQMTAFIRKKPAQPPLGEIDWKALYKLALEQNLTGALYDMVSQTDGGSGPPSNVMAKMEQIYLSTVARAVNRNMS